MMSDTELRTWTQQIDAATYTCSNNPRLVQLDALNAALGSDMLWWAESLSEAGLKRIVENLLCLGIYAGAKDKAAEGMNTPFPRLALLHDHRF